MKNKRRKIMNRLSKYVLVIIPLNLFSTNIFASDGGIELPGLGRLALAFLVICGLIYSLIYLLKKFFFKSVGKTAGSMEMLGSIMLGQKSRLCMVKVAGRAILLGVTSQQISSIAEFDPEEIEMNTQKSHLPSFIKYFRNASSSAGGRTSAM
jgi:flagellar biosynthetic protein FliO